MWEGEEARGAGGGPRKVRFWVKQGRRPCWQCLKTKERPPCVAARGARAAYHQIAVQLFNPFSNPGCDGFCVLGQASVHLCHAREKLERAATIQKKLDLLDPFCMRQQKIHQMLFILDSSFDRFVGHERGNGLSGRRCCVRNSHSADITHAGHPLLALSASIATPRI